MYYRQNLNLGRRGGASKLPLPRLSLYYRRSKMVALVFSYFVGPCVPCEDFVPFLSFLFRVMSCSMPYCCVCLISESCLVIMIT